MTKDLTFEVLEYLFANNVDSKFIDIKTPFLNKLNTQEQKGNYRNVLKKLKKYDLIVIDGDYIRVNAIIPGEDLPDSYASEITEFEIADSIGPKRPFPLDSLNIQNESRGTI